MRKVCLYILIFSCIFSIAAAAYGQGKDQKRTYGDVSKDEDMPKLHKRLEDIVKKLKIKAESDGKVHLVIDSGYFIDDYTNDKIVFYEKAILEMSGDRTKKLQIKYYQFNMRNKFRDVRSLINNNPGSSDISTMKINYSSNKAKSESFTFSDLKHRESKVKVAQRYKLALYDLIFRVERYDIKAMRRQAEKIERILDLGSEIR